MAKDTIHKFKNSRQGFHLSLFFILLATLFILFFVIPDIFSSKLSYLEGERTLRAEDSDKGSLSEAIKKIFKSEPVLDTVLYDQLLGTLANNPPPPPPVTKVVKDPTTGEESTITIEPKPVNHLWPVKTVYPNGGAILPFNRIVAYYGNLYSKKMGALGEYPEEEMLSRLQAEVEKWKAADPATEVIPALHYIAVVAQGSAGVDGKYRARMPEREIDKVISMAEKIGAIVFLDIQVGFSTLEAELPVYEKYFKMPNVHLGIDAEFSMKGEKPPGKVVGTFDAADINYAAEYLAKIVKENNLPPKVLVVHRYTQKMITNYKEIKPSPEVQIVMHMDGWGVAAKKLSTYREFIRREPVQFTGFKLFYKNDTLTGTPLMTAEELLKLNPRPIYIQYQ